MSVAEYIPFINTELDCSIATEFYSDAGVMRISLESISETGSKLPNGPKRWVDASIDGLHCEDLSKLTSDYRDYLKRFTAHASLCDPQFHASPNKTEVKQFVFSVLNYCTEHSPYWISVPQLPIVGETKRNKINRLLAENTKTWKAESGYSGKLILPAIFTHQNQLNKKTERNKKIASILGCVSAAGADGVWAVDSTLNDQEGSGKFDVRFPALRKFHEELKRALPDDAITVCGPYWGMNLIIWARNSVRFPAIGLGGTYKYNLPGQLLNRGLSRVALSPLRRWAIASPHLKTWLTETVANLSPSDPTRADFVAIEKDFSKLQISKNGKRQIASFYKSWFEKFSTLPQAGRALALYQDLSSAYVLGKNLTQLPDKKEGTARRPERVAQQLMLNCL